MRITKAQVDELFALKQSVEAATAAYDEAMKKIRDAGPNTYKGNCAALVLEERERRTVDNKAIFAAYAVPETVVAKHTRTTPYIVATFKPVQS